MITIKSFEVNYFSENIHLLYDDIKEAVLTDHGYLRKEEQREVSDFIAQSGLTLKCYLCTHLHLDHIFGNEFVHNTYGLSPGVYKVDTEGLPPPERQAKAFGLSMKAKSVPVRKYLVNGEITKLGKPELAVLSVPGHSLGGVAFYNKKNSFVIVGDSLFAGSIGRTGLWGDNRDILLAAVKNKLPSLPDETAVYPGHGLETRIVGEKLGSPYL